jgi:hypothetical protein
LDDLTLAESATVCDGKTPLAIMGTGRVSLPPSIASSDQTHL